MIAVGLAALALLAVLVFWLIEHVLPWALAFLFVVWVLPTDPTDRSSWHRSSMTVRTDCATGAEYLESHEGYLTPRLDADSLPMHRACP